MSAVATKKFRLQGKQLLLTYPQNDCSKETLLKNIIGLWKKNLKFAVVCQETHQDGDPHLHAAVSLHQRIDYRGTKRLDQLTGKHGSYEVARSLQKIVQYVAKDGNFVAHGVNVELFLSQAKKKKSTVIALGIMEGQTIAEINEIDPGFVLMNLQKVEKYLAWKELESQKEVRPCLKSLVAVGHQDSGNNGLIADWINNNLFTDRKRQVREKQLFIHGAPGLGKTRLIGLLRDAGIRVYIFPFSEKYHDLYDDDAYDLIVFDEFKGQVTITDINRWLDGQHFGVPRKGKPPFLKKKNLPFIMLSNFSPRDVYKNCSDQAFNPFLDRLQVIELDEELEVTIKTIEIENIETTDDSEEPTIVPDDALVDNGVGVGAFESDSDNDCSQTQVLVNLDDKSDYPLSIDQNTLLLSGLNKRSRAHDDQFDSQGNYIGGAQPPWDWENDFMHKRPFGINDYDLMMQSQEDIIVLSDDTDEFSNIY